MTDLVVVGKTISTGPRYGETASKSNEENEGLAEQGLIEQQTEAEGRMDKFISVGVCAMDSKTLAPPMQNILERIQVQNYIKIVMFMEKTILEEPIENWPICDCLIAFYSNGFPIEKTMKYVALRNPLVFNDLEMQYSLMDRREVYKILGANGVETPPHEVCNRDGDNDEVTLNEVDDVVEINGHLFHKPFVEKPVSAEDHNIYIYFPSDYGGGSQRLFRKVKNRSSSYSRESSVRTKGSYIYEDFLATDGTDVKVYTVGPDYAHAEARKSPALDGKVERDEAGKEVRYPVILTAKEKLIARAVCMAFKQTVCGFDLLRANGRSYVCDVNGFSFVKNSQKYYDDCAQILLEMITAHLGPHYFPSIPPSVEYLIDEIPDMPVPIPIVGNNLELRCVVGVIRHGDRTPKQKMKMIVKHKRFFDLFKELKGYDTGNLKIKKPKLLQRVLDIARELLTENNVDQGSEIQEKIHKLEQLRAVLEMYGTFSGINRKVQLKHLSKKDLNGDPQLLLILKWGGEHTQSGQHQAEELGRAFRIIYPGGEGEYASLPGSGFLRLHSTYRHDLKVYASDEGRVQMTAAAFTKGLLDLEGNPASVLVHLVKRDQAVDNMLDTSTNAQDAMNCVKETLHKFMQSPDDFTEQSYPELAPTEAEPVIAAMKKIENPRAACMKVYDLIKSLLAQMQALSDREENYMLYHEETLQLMVNRWKKLEKDFKLKNGRFDISKIPDIYDCIKYDLLHNSSTLDLKVGKELLRSILPLADIVMPQEYGISKDEKLDIAHKICTPLLRKIQADFHHTIVNEQADVLHRLDHRLSKGVVSPKRHVRTRLYFTSESHVHSLTNILKFDRLIQKTDEKQKEEDLNIHNVPELNYLTQIVFLLYEDLSKPEKSDIRYCVYVHFSPGVRSRDELTAPQSDDIDGKQIQSQIVKRLPLDGQNRHSDYRELFNDLDRPKEFVVRRLSEQHHSGRLLLTAAGGIKSFSETEMLSSSQRRAVENVAVPTMKVTSRSRSMDLLNPVQDYLGRSGYVPVERPFSENILQKSDANVVGRKASFQKSLATLKIKEEDEEEEARKGVSLKGKGSNEQLNRKSGMDPLKSSSLGERGLVLATELSSAIFPLTPIGEASLTWVNQYLTSITGVHLDYNIVAQEDPPLARMRTLRSRENSGDLSNAYKTNLRTLRTRENSGDLSDAYKTNVRTLRTRENSGDLSDAYMTNARTLRSRESGDLFDTREDRGRPGAGDEAKMDYSLIPRLSKRRGRKGEPALCSGSVPLWINSGKCSSAPPLKGRWSSGGKPDSSPESECNALSFQVSAVDSKRRPSNQ